MVSTKKNEEAVSPVIGVILMVAVTVILAAIIAAFVFNMAGNLSSPKTVGLTLVANSSGNGIVTIQGGSSLPELTSLKYTINGTGAPVALTGITYPPSAGSVGDLGTSKVTASRVIITGTFNDGSTSILIDKQF